MSQYAMPPLDVLFLRFGLALFLGFLIGLEREREKEQIFAGMRTFALISLLGATLAFVSEQFTGPWLIIIGFVIVSAFALLSHMRMRDVWHIGITTEVAFLLAFMLGALVYWDMLTLAAAMTVVVVLILTFKPNLQTFLSSVAREDIWAGLEFAVVWVVVMPILPDRTYGPLDVLNPREVWLTVVFVAGLNLAAYILSLLYGVRRGIGIIGILGGLISSTAVAFEFARRSKKEDQGQYTHLFTLAIAIASAGMFIRVWLLTVSININLAITLLFPMLAGCSVALVGVLWFWWRSRAQKDLDLGEIDAERRRSPFALRPALQFGLIFAIVLWFSKAAQFYMADAGAYLSGVIGGIAGLDAITLSMARLSMSTVSETVATRSIVLGVASNMLFKGSIAAIIGAGEVRRSILPLFLLAATASVLVGFLVI
jgi:uncharacterized membrane protein (DUF4010 family)